MDRSTSRLWLILVAFVVMTLGGAVLTASGFAHQSPTVDEPTHLVRGLSYWWTGDTKLSYAHPPLANAIAAAPGALRDRASHVQIDELPGWKDANPGRITIGVANRDYEALRSQWVLGRYAMLAASLVFLTYLFAWMERRLGGLAALGAIGLLVVNPTFWAHASLVTTDGAMVGLFTVALCELVATLETRTIVGAVRFGLALGLALLAKFSAVVLVPLAGAVVVVCAAVGLSTRFRELRPGARIVRLARDVAVVALVAGTMVNAGYRFQRTCWTVERVLAEPEPQNNISNDYDDDLLEKKTPLASLPKGLVVPLPYPWVFGVSTIKVQTTGGHPLKSYFLGEVHRDGVAYYFPLLLLLKTPLVLWAAAAVGAFVALRKRTVAVLLPAGLAAVFLASLTTSDLNIGVRHALPAIPAFAMLGGVGLAAFFERLPLHVPRFAPALAAVGVGLLASAERDFLGYFNALAGDEARRRHVSVVGEDWGQNAAALGHFAQRRGIDRIGFVGIGHTGTRELERLDVHPIKHRCARPEGVRWVALHDSKFVRSPQCFRWLPDQPTTWIDNHIRVYDLGVPRARDRDASRGARDRI